MTALILLKDFLETQIELWRPIEGLPDGYDVSNLGNIRSWREKYKYIGKMGWGWRMSDHSHVVGSFPDKDGYLLASIDRKLTFQLGYKPFIHQIVARHFVAGYSQGLTVNHRNFIKTDNRGTNLEWLTRDANRCHAVENNMHVKGERVHSSKMTENKVREIRQLRATGIGTNTLAALFGLNRSSVKAIVYHRTWKHIT